MAASSWPRRRRAALDIDLDALNTASTADFVHALDEVFEDAPWVAEQTAAARPFATVAVLHVAMMEAVRAAPAERVLAFLRGHPELAGAAAAAGTMGAASTAEQAALGLHRPDAASVPAMNAAYAARFGFPFILCVRRHTRTSLLAEFERRLRLDPAAERDTALAEIGYITRLRLAERVSGPGAPLVHGSLTTHVLDSAVGRPAEGCVVELLEVGGDPVTLATRRTNADGRTDAPLLSGAPLRIGVYELRFHVGDYYAGPAQPPFFGAVPFLGVVPIRFGISAPETHYHVPLLVSPGAYSTYRGS